MNFLFDGFGVTGYWRGEVSTAFLLFGCIVLSGWVWYLRRKVVTYQTAQRELLYISEHDLLSGLKNRNAFMRQLDQYAAACLTVLICDIDGLKLVNDQLGHTAGDRLIRGAANILQCICPSDAQIFRIGGDEFLALLPADYSLELEAEIRRKLQWQVRLFNECHKEVPLSLSIGLAGTGQSGFSLSEAINQADACMYRQKQAGHAFVLARLKDILPLAGKSLFYPRGIDYDDRE